MFTLLLMCREIKSNTFNQERKKEVNIEHIETPQFTRFLTTQILLTCDLL